MIVRPKRSRFGKLIAWHGSALNMILVPLGVIFVLALVAVWGAEREDHFFVRLNPVPFSLMGVALAIFVSFRNNACYERFCDARKLWGMLMNRARDIARLATTVPGLRKSHPEVRETINLLAAFAHALKHQLRSTEDSAEGLETLSRLLGAELAHSAARRNSVPQYLLQLLQERFVVWHREGRLSDILLDSCQAKLAVLSEVQGGCERIRNTPIPYAYDVLLHRTTYFYCALLPFGLVDSIGWTTPLISVFIAYAFMALDEIAGELEDPFGEDPNDLPLAALAVNIERALGEAMDADVLPPKPVPDERCQLR